MRNIATVDRAPAAEDAGRADVYGFLAHLLTVPPCEQTLASLRAMRGAAGALGAAINDLARKALNLSADAAAQEFSALFIGLTEGELQPYASFYRSGFLFEKPLADLRQDMRALGIARSDGNCHPEDHIASLCEMMHGLILGGFGPAADLRTQRAFFEAHLAPWARNFFEDLEGADSASLYRTVGTIGRVFFDLEREGFALAT